MTRFHAVMISETGEEFGADVDAADHEEAYDKLKDRYPESRVDQLESPEETAAREQRIYEWAARQYDEGYYYDE